MPNIVITAYRPKPGQENALFTLTRKHVPLLQALGLATARQPIAMVGGGGVIIEVFEWAKDGIARAHETPEVQALWAQYAEISDYVPLRELPETAAMFATFAPIDLTAPRPQPRAFTHEAALSEVGLEEVL